MAEQLAQRYPAQFATDEELYQQALRLAIRTSSQQGESLACANLALAAARAAQFGRAGGASQTCAGVPAGTRST